MKSNIRSEIVVAVAVLALLGAGCGNQQAKPVCLVGNGFYGVQFMPKGTPPAGCENKAPERLGVAKYSVPTSNIDIPFHPPNAGGEGAPADSSPKIALLPGPFDGPSLASPAAPPGRRDQSFIATGALAADEPAADDMCMVEGFNTVTDAAAGISYAFSHLHFFVTAAIPGTQFMGGVHYTSPTCETDFDLVGIYPGNRCGSYVCDPEVDPEDCVSNATGDPDVTLCGSGANPNFPLRCDAASLVCVSLETEVPSFCPNGRVAEEDLAPGALEWPCK